MNTKYCCPRFAVLTSSAPSFVGGGFLYPNSARPEAQIEFDGKNWNVNGCCGGGCYVLDKIEFCPFCGTKLKREDK